MQYFNVFVILVFMATICSVILILYTIKHRNVDKSYFLIFLSAATYLYTFGYLLEITSSTLETAFCTVRMQYTGLPFILPISYLFVRDIYGEKHLGKLKLFFLFSVPVLTVITMQLYPLMKIFYSNIEYISNGYIANCRVYPGPFYHLYTGFSYLIFLLIIRLIIIKLRGSSKLKKQQSLILLAACLIPTLCSIPYVLSTAKLRYDPTPIANAISMILLLYAIRYHNLINVVPLARAQVIESMDDAFIVCDKDFNFLDANEAAKQLFPELKNLIPGDAIEGVERFKDTTELSIQRGNETRFYKSTQTCILQDRIVKGICIVLHDVTENEKLLKKLRIQASFDPLMNIYNRGTLFEAAKLMLNSEKAKQLSYALLMIDLDFFKIVNDTYGHFAGDLVLKTVVSIIKKTFRKDDIIGRYGGEEIVVLFENISVEQTFRIAEELRKIIENTPISYQNHTINITISIGAAHSPAGESHSFENMLDRADAAMYEAKNSGRNRTVAE